MSAAVPWVLAALALAAGGLWVRRYLRLTGQEREQEAVRRLPPVPYGTVADEAERVLRGEVPGNG